MDLNGVFKNNVLFLQQQLRLNNAQIATIANSKGFTLTKAYVGKFLNPAKTTNISLDKVDTIAAVFNKRPVDLLNPLGFDENANPKGVEHLLNTAMLSESILDVDIVMKELNVVNAQFRAKAIAVVYEHKVTGGDTDLRSLLTTLLK